MTELKDPGAVTVEHVPPVEADVLQLGIIGSHIWGMAHEGSDVDSMAFIQEPTTRILDGTAKYQTTSVFKSHTDHGWPVDIHVHEIGRLVSMLEKGNINFFTGLLTPLPIHASQAMLDLKALVLDNPARNIYGSIHGMAVQNMSRYAGLPRGTFYSAVLERLGQRRIDIEPRRCAKMLCYLEWGLSWLDHGEPRYAKPDRYDWSPDGVVQAIRDLDVAFVDSELPAKPDGRLFRDWLLGTRSPRP